MVLINMALLKYLPLSIEIMNDFTIYIFPTQGKLFYENNIDIKIYILYHTYKIYYKNILQKYC